MKEFDTPRTLRFAYHVIGCIMVLLGIIGAVLPVMPTVPFLLVAAWCFARSSPRFHAWLYNHKIFGPPLKKWEENRAIGSLAKLWAVGGMTFGFVVFVFIIHPVWWLVLMVGAILLLVAIYILTRPSQ